jgi:hypothetical protein
MRTIRSRATGPLLDGYTRHMTDLDPHWLERLQVMGEAQSRYLWILLITMIFYGPLQERVYVDTDPLKMPIVDVEISGPFVLGFGPALISFFVLAVTGTTRAPHTARAKLHLERGDWSGEELDTSPKLDLAFYTTRQSPKLIATLIHFSYVTVLALGLYEAAWIAKQLWDRVPTRVQHHAHDAIDAEPGCSRQSAAIIDDPLGAAVLAADRRSTVSRLVRPPPCSQQF